MTWVITDGMPLPPGVCVGCGGNKQGDDGEPMEAAFAEGVDINWGDSVFICQSCGAILAKLFGFVKPTQVKKAKREMKAMERERDAAIARAEAAEDRAQRMLDGKAAVKEQKEAKSSGT